MIIEDLGVPYERVGPHAYLLTLRERLVWVIEREHDVLVESFVLHVLPSASSGLHAGLLARNLHLSAVHYAIDEVGDVFLVGHLPWLTSEGLDRALGEIVGQDRRGVLRLAYGEDVPDKALLDGAGRRPAGTVGPQRDARR